MRSEVLTTHSSIRSSEKDWEQHQDNTLLMLSASYRLLILLAINTTYVPDEYYQYAEPSFDAVYSKGIMLVSTHLILAASIPSSTSFIPLDLLLLLLSTTNNQTGHGSGSRSTGYEATCPCCR